MISGDTHARAQASGRPMGSEHRITRCARAPPGGAQVKKKSPPNKRRNHDFLALTEAQFILEGSTASYTKAY